MTKPSYRSKFEAAVARDLKARGVKFTYEPHALSWHQKVRSATCRACGNTESIYKRREYIPDFYLPETFTYIEAKGRFTADDRATMLGVRDEYPDHTFYLLFQRDNWMTKVRHQRYSDWAYAKGFGSAIGRIPDSWIK